MYSDECIEKLIDSHDELIKVCRAAFMVIVPSKKLMNKLTVLLDRDGVKEQFTHRADEARRNISFQRRQKLAAGNVKPC